MQLVDAQMDLMPRNMSAKEREDLRRQLFYEFLQGTQFNPLTGDKETVPLPVATEDKDNEE